jgi:hypothetical protein
MGDAGTSASMIQGGAKGAAGGAGGGAKPGSTNPFAIAAKVAGKTIAAGGRSLAEAAGKYAENVHPVEYRKGGKVRKTGRIKIRADERVIPAKKRKKVERLMKRAGMKLTDKKRPSKKRSKDRKDSSR